MPLRSQIQAVLRRTGLLDLGATPACRPLDHEGGRLWRVEIGDHPVVVKLLRPSNLPKPGWTEALADNRAEPRFIELFGAISPSAVPRLRAVDELAPAMVVDWLPPESHLNLLNLARAGRLDGRHGRMIGTLLAGLHGATLDRPNVGRTFATGFAFHVLRIEPLLLAAAEAHPEAAPVLKRTARRVGTTHRTLIHGEATLENLHLSPNGLVLLDADAATYGDPVFDLALILADLMLLAEAEPKHAQALVETAHTIGHVWLERLGGRLEADVQRQAVGLTAALALGRLDGMLPLTAIVPRAAEAIRVRATALLERPSPTLGAALKALRGS